MNTPIDTPEPKSFGQMADEFLVQYYESYGATTIDQKIKLIQLELGEGPSNYYAFGGGTVTDEMKLGCLEYDLLERKRLITLVLA